MRLLTWLIAPSIVLAGLVGSKTALAQKKTGPTHTVQDDAGLFSAEAKDRANQTIRQIKTQFKKDFLVETLAAAPEDVKDAGAYAKWAEGRAKNQNIEGVYVVITKKPSRLRVVVGPQTRDLGYFTSKNLDDLSTLMLAKLKEQKNDEALTEGAAAVLDTLTRNKSSVVTPAKKQPAQAANPAPAANNAGGINWGMWILIGLAVLLGIWVITALIRAFSGGGSASPGMAGGGYGGGGGGFFSTFLTGMLGAAAGMWLYSSFFGGHTPSAYGGDSSGAAGSSGAEPTDVGGDYSSTGGDYGGDAGGDAGGGGGGDWGGGGGDWGGGGGDFGGGGE